jgi:hypothetical protein
MRSAQSYASQTWTCSLVMSLVISLVVTHTGLLGEPRDENLTVPGAGLEPARLLARRF